MGEESRTSRRGLILGLGGLIAIAWGWQRFGIGIRKANYSPIPGLPGWQQVVSRAVSGQGNATSAVFLGLGDEPEVATLAAADLCRTLYRNRGSGPPVAFFTDVNCPNCRLLLARLAGRELSITWHQLPLLGPASELGARALEAALMQPNGEAFVMRLHSQSLRPSPEWLARLAGETGLDPNRLLADMQSPQVLNRLAKSRAAAATLGIWGTPGLAVGRTLVMGAVDGDILDQVIASENPGSC